MSRFAADPVKLEQDGAMIAYRKQAVKDPHGLDPAEWIEALHHEHWATLKLCATPEGEHVAIILAGLQTVLRSSQVAVAELERVRRRFSDVLGNTPAVADLREVERDLHSGVAEALQAVIRGATP